MKRSYEFAKIGWNNYDFDHSYLYELMLFKLQRIEAALKNGYAEHDKSTLQSIRISIKLLKRITANSYFYFTDLHSKKWGPLTYNFSEIENINSSELIFTRKNALTEEQKQLEKNEFLKAYQKDAQQEMRDIRLLFDIMKKYSKTWWD